MKDISVVLLCALLTRCDAGDAPQGQAALANVIDRAIWASEATSALQKAVGFQLKASGTAHIDGDSAKSESASITWLPDRYRAESKLYMRNGVDDGILGINGDQVWIRGRAKLSGPYQVMDLLGTRSEEKCKLFLHEITYFPWLLKETNYTVRYIGDSRIEKKDVVGVEITMGSEMGKAKLFYDATGLLVQMDWIMPHPVSLNKSVVRRYEFSRHQKLNGLVVPKKTVEQVNDGKRMEMTITEFSVLQKAPDKRLFERP